MSTTAYAQYIVEIDLDNDRQFISAGEDVSAYVKAPLVWQLGSMDPWATIARTSTARIVLSNVSGHFSPEGPSGLIGFRPGALIRIRTVYGGTTQHFIGWIDPDGIQVKPGRKGPRETVVRASGFFSRLMDEPVRVPLQLGKRTDEIIIAILDGAPIYPPGFAGWLLGLAGFSELGENTYLETGVTDYAVLDSGNNTFNYVGDNWSALTSIFMALQDLLAAERGYLFEDRSGRIVYYNRHHWTNDLSNPLDATLTGSDLLRLQGMDYAYGDVINKQTIKCHPRLVDGSTSVVGRANTTLTVLAGSSASASVRFDDGLGNHIGALGVITPAPTTDWTANSADDGSGTDLTGDLSVSAVIDANSAQITFTNTGATKAYVRNLQVRGTKITDFGEVEVAYQDDESISQYGKQAETLALSLLDDLEMAQSLARWDVLIRKDAHGRARSITVKANTSSALMSYALGQTMGNRIEISESWTGHDGIYFIVGERHEVNQRRDHLVTHYLRPADQAFWVLGVSGLSELGITTVLGV